MAIQPNDDTAAWLSLFKQHMDDMFNYIFTMREQGRRHEFSPYMDVYEASDQYVIEVDLPGFSEGDFNISSLGTTLRIEGIKRQEKSDSAVSFICLERHFGRFSRNLEIPAGFDPARIAATYERGVLTIKVAKR